MQKFQNVRNKKYSIDPLELTSFSLTLLLALMSRTIKGLSLFYMDHTILILYITYIYRVSICCVLGAWN